MVLASDPSTWRKVGTVSGVHRVIFGYIASTVAQARDPILKGKLKKKCKPGVEAQACNAESWEEFEVICTPEAMQ